MDRVWSWFGRLGEAGGKFADRVIEFIPYLIGAILLLLAGWIVALLLKRLTVRLVQGFNAALERLHERRRIGRLHVNEALIGVIGTAVFWLIYFVFIALAAELLGLYGLTRWLARAVNYLPIAFAVVVILIAGVIASDFMRRLVAASSAAAGIGQAELLGRAAQASVLVGAVIIGLDQIDIDVTFLIVIISILVACVLGGLSLAFALGARGYVSNVIGAHYASRRFHVGERVRIGAVEGTVLEITSTAIVLATKEGTASLPARLFTEEASLLMTEAARDE
jgi:small-conductance mechanosensitive channel